MFSHLLNQVITALCGFIVPKLFLESFGSEVNGIISSITQFLGVIALLESGFGSVAKTAFYKPLALGNNEKISGVFNATESFFRKIALFFAGYCVILSFIFPLIKESSFDYWFVLTLVLILGANSFMQYYFGVSYTILMNADQISYISGFLQVIIVILNAIVTVILINIGASVHIVKLVSACVFILKPILMNIYGRKKYQLNFQVPKDKSSLSQKWDNFGQSIAFYVHTKTDAILLTVFVNFSEVSVYSVYSLVTTSLSTIITSISSGFVSALGNMYTNDEKGAFDVTFSLYEFVNTFVTFLFYTIAFIVIIPFVKVYTINVTDVDYIRPLFACIIIIAELLYCLRLPYYYVIINARHFKQIKKGAYVEAGLNILVSLVLINLFGIVGVVIGTSLAMLYRTIQLVIYCSKNIIKRTPLIVMKRFAVNFVGALCSVLVSKLFVLSINNFLELFIYTCIIGLISFAILSFVNIMFFKDDFNMVFKRCKNVFKINL